MHRSSVCQGDFMCRVQLRSATGDRISILNIVILHMLVSLHSFYWSSDLLRIHLILSSCFLSICIACATSFFHLLPFAQWHVAWCRYWFVFPPPLCLHIVLACRCRRLMGFKRFRFVWLFFISEDWFASQCLDQSVFLLVSFVAGCWVLVFLLCPHLCVAPNFK